MISKEAKIYVTGHNGMVGSACWRALTSVGYTNLIGKTSKELDLRNQQAVDDFIKTEKPDAIIDAAAKVGGILANDTYPYEFLMDNMLIQNNLLRSAHENDIEKFIFLGSSCIYPKHAKQPLKEDYLLTGPLEPTNESYAIAKISGVKLIEALRKQFNRDYVSLMPTNLYGPNDNFDLKTSHVFPALVRKFHEAKENNYDEVILWGTGSPKREFLHVDDFAKAVLLAMENNFESSIYNVGYGTDFSIKETALIIKNVVGYKGNIKWDTKMPDGTPRKLLDSFLILMKGWKPSIDLASGVKQTYDWFLNNQETQILGK